MVQQHQGHTVRLLLLVVVADMRLLAVAAI